MARSSSDPYETPDLYDADHAGYDEDVAFYAGLAKGVVLDLGCGSGRVTAPLLDTGAEVWGVDRSAAMLAAAERRCQGRARLVLGDLGDVPLPAFDLAIAANDTLSRLAPGALRSLLVALRQAARPGARLAFDVYTWVHALAGAGGEDVRDVWVDGALVRVAERTAVDARRRELTVTTSWPTAETTLRTRLVTDRAWRSRLRRAGWQTVSVTSDFGGTEPAAGDPKRVYVARLQG